MTPTERKRLRTPHQPVGRWIRPWRRLAIYLRDGFRCVHCGTDLSRRPPCDVTLDHLVPRTRHRGAKGGPNRTTNLVTACRPCNDSRGERSLRAWAISRGMVFVEPRYAYATDQARKSIAPHVALAKALTTQHPWPTANLHARLHARGG